MEVVPCRQQPKVIETLKRFKNVRTVTRDFSKTYRAAITEALPNAKQIVDRFHVLKNLTDDIADYIKRTVSDKIRMVDTSATTIETKEVLNKREQKKVETGLKRWEVIKEVHRLKADGMNHSQISRLLHITRPTVIKYLGIIAPPIDSRPCLLDPFVPRIKELILAGYKYSEIYAKIKEEGYTGKISLYNSKMKGIRYEVKHNLIYLKRSDIKKLLYQPMNEFKSEEKRHQLSQYLNKHEELKKVLDMVHEFKSILLGSDPNRLEGWLENATQLNIQELNSFIKLIRWDQEAVENAIHYKYSNGLTEGHNNKIKVIKRQMYGRCNFDLLRLKVLAQFN